MTDIFVFHHGELCSFLGGFVIYLFLCRNFLACEDEQKPVMISAHSRPKIIQMYHITETEITKPQQKLPSHMKDTGQRYFFRKVII